MKPPVAIDERRGLPSASKAQLYLDCPGSFHAEQAVEEKPEPTPEMLRGTRIHEWLEKGEGCLETEEKLVAARLYQKAQGMLVAAEAPAITPFRELRLTMCDEASAKPVFSGKADLMVVDATTAWVLDYKTGDQFVPTHPNEQLRMLAALAHETFGSDQVFTAIVQDDGFNGIWHLYDEAALRDALTDLRRMLQRVNDPHAPRHPGPWCKWCAGRNACEESSRYYAPVQTTGWPAPQMWTPHHWSVFLKMRTGLENWLKDRQEEAKKILKADPGAIPGWHLKPGNTPLTITNVPLVMERAADNGISVTALLAAVKLSTTALREEVHRVAKERSLDKFGEEALFANLVVDASEVKQNEPTLASEK